MMRRSAYFLAAAWLVGCDDQFSNNGNDGNSNGNDPSDGTSANANNDTSTEPFNPLKDSYDIDVRGSNLVGVEGARVVVAVYNRSQTHLEARSDFAVENGGFRFYFDNELEKGYAYSIYWWVDLGNVDDCHDDTVYVHDIGVSTSARVVQLNPDVDLVSNCDNVDGNYPLTD